MADAASYMLIEDGKTTMVCCCYADKGGDDNGRPMAGLAGSEPPPARRRYQDLEARVIGKALIPCLKMKKRGIWGLKIVVID